MLLPAAERRGEIHFYIAKSLPYLVRLTVAFCLMAAGLAMQVAPTGLPFWAGLPVVLAGVLMLLTKGYENKVETQRAPAEWRSSRRTEVERIITLNRQQKAWDRDVLDITCGRGLLSLVVMAALVAIGAGRLMGESFVLAQMLIANAAVMLLPFWVTGVRSILKNDRLVVKADLFLKIESVYEAAGKGQGEDFQYQIQTGEASDRKGEVPRDVKAILAFHEASADFLGLQMQISINSVQGSDYPYFYCVLVAREAFGLIDRVDFANVPRKVTLETEHSGDMSIVIIRQTTTRQSGYHTDWAATRRIFAYALQEARRLTEKR